MRIHSLTTTLTVLAGTLAGGEFVSAVIIWRENYRGSLPAAGIVFGILFLLGTALMRSRRVTFGAIYVGVLCLFEVVNYPTWQRHNALDWAYQTGYLIVSMAGLATAVALLVARRRSSSVTA
jgi:hypothetical protein